MGSCGGINPVTMEQRWNLSTPDPMSITEDRWLVAEETIQEVLNCIHPTLDTEEKRKDVIDYVQRLIRCSLGCEVFPYGSVPLKTYLPDGDIDLTVLSSNYSEETLAHDVLAVLQEEENRENAEFDVKDTQFIDAEVKLVKCFVRNTVIDISFNQLGGLCSLCFLEQIDRSVGKNHLFKRSIILAKAWCYYESRILGAHHGLISTYALEILVLYIFHMYHSSLSGPLAVLYRFLDYYSKFDWDIYCVSLNGPVRKASLPDIVVEMPDNARNNVLLSKEFLKNCMEMFSVPPRDAEMNTRAFQQKHLNIIDPLKENNNLGRSVHRGNFHRIRRAFKYGARKLGRILLSPSDRVAYEIRKFFANTLERHGCKHLSHLQSSSPNFADEGTFSSLLPAEFYSEDDILLKLSEGDLDNDNVEMVYKCSPSSALGTNLMNGAFLYMVSENGYFLDGQAVSGLRLSSVANDLAASISVNLNVANGTSDNKCSGTGNNISSPSGKQYSTPHCDFSEPCAGHGNCGPGTFCHNDLFDRIDDKLSSDLWVETRVNPLESSSIDQSGTEYSEGIWSGGSAISSPKTSILEGLSLDIRERDSASLAGDVEAINPLVDLTGDYDSHIRNLLYGQCCHGFSLSAVALSNYPSSPSWCGSENFCDTVQQSMLRHQSFSQMALNNMLVCPTVQLSCYSLSSTAMLSSKVKKSAQGTGTYSLNANHARPEIPKGWDQNLASGTYSQLHMYNSNNINGWVPAFSDTNSSAKCNQEVSGVQSPVQSHGEFSVLGQPHHINGQIPAFSDTNSSGKGTQQVSRVQSAVQGQGEFAVSGQSHHNTDGSHANDFSNSCRLEFGTLGTLTKDALSSHDVLSVSRSLPCSKPALGKNERTSEHLFRLKNEDEFPPL